MDWARAIETNQAALTRIVAELIAMLGLMAGGTADRLAFPLYRAVLRVLRPAESAVRRLIIVAARDLVMEPSAAAARPAPKRLARSAKGGARLRFSCSIRARVSPGCAVAPPARPCRAFASSASIRASRCRGFRPSLSSRQCASRMAR